MKLIVTYIHAAFSGTALSSVRMKQKEKIQGHIIAIATELAGGWGRGGGTLRRVFFCSSLEYFFPCLPVRRTVVH